MNKIIMLLCSFIALASTNANANDSCQVFFNKQLLFKGSVDQQDAIAYLKSTQLKKTDCITIKYFTEQANKGWHRTFYIDDGNNNNLKTIELGKQTGTVTVDASVLNVMKDTKKAVSIYTISLPVNKAMAARIRVRRMFICKVEWN